MNWDSVAVSGSRNIFHNFLSTKKGRVFLVKNQISNLHFPKVAQRANAEIALQALLLMEQTLVPSFNVTVC